MKVGSGYVWHMPGLVPIAAIMEFMVQEGRQLEEAHAVGHEIFTISDHTGPRGTTACVSTSGCSEEHGEGGSLAPVLRPPPIRQSRCPQSGPNVQEVSLSLGVFLSPLPRSGSLRCALRDTLGQGCSGQRRLWIQNEGAGVGPPPT